ncbi:hypothetical protein ACKWTF_015657 [Chironomus riparius]
MRRVINLILVLTILTQSISLSNAFVIKCRYNEWDWNFKQKVYECQGTALELDESPGYVVDVRGEHMIGGNLTEVDALRFMHKENITFIPNGIGKFFPNLKGLSFMNCNIKTISKDHLAEFPQMFQLSYSLNAIEYVPGDTFIYTPKVQLINFSGNNIKRIGLGLFKPLKNLQYIWFEKNVCINMNAKVSAFKQLRQEIKQHCYGGKTECSKIPRILTRWNDTKPVEMCELIKVYKFKPKPWHELEKFEREKAQNERKQKEDYIKKVLKICEYPTPVYRFIETIYYKVVKTNDKDIKLAMRDEREKKTIDTLLKITGMDKFQNANR